MPDTPKQPQDHKKKSTEDHFSFEHKGETYVFEKSLADMRSPRFLRANRRRSELDLAFTIIEEIGGQKVAEVVDDMDEKEFEALSEQIGDALTASAGESKAS